MKQMSLDDYPEVWRKEETKMTNKAIQNYIIRYGSKFGWIPIFIGCCDDKHISVAFQNETEEKIVDFLRPTNVEELKFQLDHTIGGK